MANLFRRTKPSFIATTLPAFFAVVVCLSSLGFSAVDGETAQAATRPIRTIRVLVWDERQPQQKQAYDHFLGNQIADHLRLRTDLAVKSVGLDDPEQGLSVEALEQTDVLIWWGHVRQREVKWEWGDRIVQRIKEGKLALIALHAAHWSTPFIKAMNERTWEDAMKSLSEEERKQYTVSYVLPKAYLAPRPDQKLTPSWTKRTAPDGSKVLDISLPLCVFPAYRADGAPSHMTTLLPHHPIARGIPESFDIEHTEMYDEPFHVPQPDQVVFEEKWDKGEHFRSGCVWNIGRGKVFYFRPGHEIYSVYKQEIPLKIVENAVDWLGGEVAAGAGK